MNTPKKPKQIKRWPFRDYASLKSKGAQTVASRLTSEAHLALLGLIISEFGHMEQAMCRVLAQLIGGADAQSATIIAGAIINPNAKIELMKSLLENSSRNAGLGAEWDDLIDEYGAVNKIRNSYIHGLWYTTGTGAVLLAPTKGDDMQFIDGREVKIAELEAFSQRVSNLAIKAIFWPNVPPV